MAAGNNEFVEFLSKNAIRDLEHAISLLDEGIQKTNTLGKQIKVIQLPSESTRAIKDMNRDIIQLNAHMGHSITVVEKERQAFEKLQKQEEANAAKRARIRMADIKLEKDRERAFDRYEKQLQKEANDLNAASNLYNKVQGRVRELTSTYNDLSIRKSLGQKLNTKEEAQLLSLEKRLLKYQSALAATDAKIGKYHRNVGNYASGNAQLSMAIGQFSRELPNAGISFSTFAISLSNQFGQLQDAISATIAQNKELIAQGVKVKSVGAQVLGSILSLNTVMYLGIALFTAYNEEISDFVTNLFKGSKAVDAAKESAKQLNDVRVESLKSITQERVELQANLETAQDTTLSYKEREIAANKILQQYPFWFENLGKEAIMNGNVEKAVKGVNEALLARAKANAAVGKITENQSKIIDLEEERFAIIQSQEKAEERLRAVRRRTYAASEQERGYEAETNAIKDINNAKEEIIDLNKEIASVQEINNRLTGYAIQQTKESIGLDYQSVDAKKLSYEATKDFIASEYELIQARLENQASANERIFQSDEVNLKKREQAFADYLHQRTQLSENTLNEELRLIQKGSDEEIKELEKRAKDGEITEKNARQVIWSVQKQAQFDSLKAYEDYYERQRQIDIAREESMKGVWDAINFQKAENLISERDLAATKEYGDLLSKITKDTDYKQFEQAQKSLAESNRSITKANIQLEIDRANTELLGLKDTEANVAKRLELQNQIIEKEKELTDVTNKELEEQAQAWMQLQKATEDFLKGITASTLSDFGLGSLNQFFDGSFKKLLDGANTVQEQFAVTFNAITSVAQEAFAFLNQNSQAYFDAQYARLDRQKEVELGFAHDNAAGKEEIERQYEEKKREIRIKEAKAQKEQALFNAIINTAQAVVAALPNIPLSILIGALGAAQIALIAGRPLPQYADGTANHPGGPMMVNDAKGSNYKEMVVLPGGKSFIPQQRNAILNAPKGTKVLKAGSFNEELNGILASNSIGFPTQLLNQMPNINIDSGRGLSKKDLEDALNNTIGKMPTVNQSFTKNGFRSWVRTETGAKESLNNIVKVKGL